MILDANGQPWERTWAQLADTATDRLCVLPDGTEVAYDPRTGLWVPACFVDSWTLSGHVNEDTDLASLPSGFGKTETNTGTVTGGSGNPIVLSAPANADVAKLLWTDSAARVTGKIAVVADVDSVALPGTSPGNALQLPIRHANLTAAAAWNTGYVVATSAKLGFWSGLASDGWTVAITGRHQLIARAPVVTITERSQLLVMDRDPVIVTTATLNHVNNYIKCWYTNNGNDYAGIAAYNTDGAPTAVECTLYAMSVYTKAS